MHLLYGNVLIANKYPSLYLIVNLVVVNFHVLDNLACLLWINCHLSLTFSGVPP